MNLVNEQVEHMMFKGGKVIKQETTYVIIQFSEQYGIKKFVYPDAFKGYLELQNKQLQGEVLEKLNLKQIKIEEEKETRLQEYKEKVESEKAILKSTKKKSTKKPKASNSEE